MIRKEKRSNESILSEIKNLLFSPSFSKKNIWMGDGVWCGEGVARREGAYYLLAFRP